MIPTTNTQRIIFPETRIPSGLIACTFTLTFINPLFPFTVTNHQARDIPLALSDIADITTEYDDAVPLLITSSLTVEFADPHRSLFNALLDKDLDFTTSFFQIYLNGNSFFLGSIEEDSIQLYADGKIKTTFSPLHGQIAAKRTHDDNNILLNPCPQFPMDENFRYLYPVKDVIEALFKIPDNPLSGIAISVDWGTTLQDIQFGFNAFSTGGKYLNQLHIDYRYLFGYHNKSSEWNFTLHNAKDVLKSLLLTLGLWGGYTSCDKALIRPFHTIAAARTITNKDIGTYERNINSRKINKLILKTDMEERWYAGESSASEKHTIAVRGLQLYYMYDQTPESAAKITHIKFPGFTVAKPYMLALTEIFGSYYLSSNQKREDIFTIKGIDFSLNERIIYGNANLFPISIAANIKNSTSVLKLRPFYYEDTPPVVFEEDPADLPLITSENGDYTQQFTISEAEPVITLARSPFPGSVKVYVNGLRQSPGDDYINEGAEITFLYELPPSAAVTVDYTETRSF